MWDELSNEDSWNGIYVVAYQGVNNRQCRCQTMMIDEDDASKTIHCIMRTSRAKNRDCGYPLKDVLMQLFG